MNQLEKDLIAVRDSFAASSKTTFEHFAYGVINSALRYIRKQEKWKSGIMAEAMEYRHFESGVDKEGFIYISQLAELLNSEQKVKECDTTESAQGVPADPQISQLALQAAIRQRDEARAEVERLRGEREALIGEKRDLLDAIEELMSWQNGAPLPTYTKGWTAAMERAEALLTQNKQP
jgi:vacuolar-type H+-ATPase subunit I/STV1